MFVDFFVIIRHILDVLDISYTWWYRSPPGGRRRSFSNVARAQTFWKHDACGTLRAALKPTRVARLPPGFYALLGNSGKRIGVRGLVIRPESPTGIGDCAPRLLPRTQTAAETGKSFRVKLGGFDACPSLFPPVPSTPRLRRTVDFHSVKGSTSNQNLQNLGCARAQFGRCSSRAEQFCVI